MKNTKLISLGLLLIGQLTLGVLLVMGARYPDRYGYTFLGAAVGWLLYYFIRRYKVFSPRSLGATLSAVIGGEALAWLAHLRGSSIPIETQYFTGLGVGFFLYALYAGFCSWLYAAGVIDSPHKFEIAIGCGTVDSKELDEVEAVMEFEEKVGEWSAGALSDEQLRVIVDGLKISRPKLAALIESGQTEIAPDVVDKIQKAQVLPLRRAL